MILPVLYLLFLASFSGRVSYTASLLCIAYPLLVVIDVRGRCISFIKHQPLDNVQDDNGQIGFFFFFFQADWAEPDYDDA